MKKRDYRTAWVLSLISVSLLLQIVGLTFGAYSQTTVSGRVVEVNSQQPLPGVIVDLRKPDGLDPYPLLSSYTDATGKYVLASVPSGQWRIRAVVAAGSGVERVLMTPVVEIENGTYVYNFEVNLERDVLSPTVMPITLTRTGHINVTSLLTVTGRIAEFRSNTPIEGAQVRLLHRTEDAAKNGSQEIAASAATGADGRFTLPPVRADRYFLNVSHSGYKTSPRAPILVNAPMEIVVRMWTDDAPPQIPGRILDENDQPLENIAILSRTSWLGILFGILYFGNDPASGAEVVLLDPSGKTVQGVAPGKADHTGVFRIEAIDPGIYAVRIRFQDNVIDVPDVVVEPGASELNIQF